MSENQIEKRKNDHIRLCLEKDVLSQFSNGFEKYRLVYNALPNLDLNQIDLSTTVLGKKLNYPLLLSAMTGGTTWAKEINQNLARVAQKLNIAMCVGSQRAMLKDPSVRDTFTVRDVAPDILLFANIGAIQLNYGYGLSECQKVVDAIGANALVLHLNPLHEAVQPEGDTNFKGLEKKIEMVAKKLSVPVFIKEVGCGISGEVARRLIDCGVQGIDVAGSGGTSFPVVEGYRAQLPDPKLFGQLGISTAESLIAVRRAVGDSVPVIASGGITNGIEAAKALALGADCVGFAGVVLRAATESDNAIEEVVLRITRELQVALFSAGVGSVREAFGKVVLC